MSHLNEPHPPQEDIDAAALAYVVDLQHQEQAERESKKNDTDVQLKDLPVYKHFIACQLHTIQSNLNHTVRTINHILDELINIKEELSNLMVDYECDKK